MSKSDDKRKRCGSTDTARGKPCRRFVPCVYHPADGEPKKKIKKTKNRDVLRQEKLLKFRLQGMTMKEAGRQAGYSEKVVTSGKIGQIFASPEMQARIQAHVERVQFDTDEIAGTLISHMRGDFGDFLSGSAVVASAREKGMSHLIKRITRRPIIAGFDNEGEPILDWEEVIEIQDQQGAARLLTKVYGMEQLPAPNKKAQRELEASIERIMQKSRDRGVTLTDAQLRKKILKYLKPKFQGVVSDANN